MVTEQECDNFAKKYWPNDSLYPNVHSVSLVRKRLKSKFTVNITTMSMSDTDVRCIAIQKMFEDASTALMLSLDDSDFPLFERILRRADKALIQVQKEIIWADYEYES